MASRQFQMQCPQCNARLRIHQELNGRTVKCPTCGRALSVSCGATNQVSSSIDPLSPSGHISQSKHVWGEPNSRPNHSSAKYLVVAIAIAGTGAIAIIFLAVVAGVAFFVLNSKSERVAETAMILDAKEPSIPTDFVGPLVKAKPMSPSGSFSNPLDVASPLSASQVVDHWFEMRRASEEGERAKVVQPGSRAYDERVERYLEGERLSRATLRSAMGVHGDETLRQEFASRQREFFDGYLFGIDPPEVMQSEAVVRKDPRLAKRRWKDAFVHYMSGPFFVLSEPRSNKFSREFLPYVETLGEFAEVLNRWEKDRKPGGRQRLDELNEAMFELAIGRLDTTGFYPIPEDHSKAEYAYTFFIRTRLDEMKAAMADQEVDRLESEFEFVHTLNEELSSHDVQQLRRQWAEVKDPSLRQERLTAEAEARKTREQERKEQMQASLDARRAEAEARSERNVANASQGRGGQMPGGLADRIGNRGERGNQPTTAGPGPRFGPRGPQGISRPGISRQGPGAPADFDGITLVIRGDRNSKPTVDRLSANDGASLVSYRRSGSDTTAWIKWDHSFDMFVDQIDFGKVIETDRDQKRIVVEVAPEP